jgi:hypothetical protein
MSEESLNVLQVEIRYSELIILRHPTGLLIMQKCQDKIYHAFVFIKNLILRIPYAQYNIR